MKIDSFFNGFSILLGVAGGTLSYLLGGWDTLLVALTTLVILDFVTGIIKAVYTKVLSSTIGLKGICKKVIVFILVAAAHVVQNLVGDTIPLREIVLVFFIANEGLSLLENAAVFVPIPGAFKKALLQLRNETGQNSRDGAEKWEDSNEEKRH